MKAATIYGPHQEFKIEDVKKPVLEERSAIIKVKASGVCGTELDFYEGIFPIEPNPLILGHEIAGVIDEIMPGSPFKVGDRVVIHNMMGCGICRYCHKGKENLCINPKGQLGFNAHGGFAEYTIAPINNLVALPDNVSFEEGAVLGCSGMTAVHASRLATIDLDEVVVVNGVGGVGLSVIQVAKLRGARVIAICDSDWRIELAKDAGADDVIVIEDYKQLPEKVRDITDGGADVYFELVGTEFSMQAGVDCLRSCGRFIIIGYQKSDFLTVSPVKLLKGEKQIIGSVAASKSDLQAALNYASRGLLKIMIDKKIRIEDINFALKELVDRKVRGRNIVVWD